MTHDDRMEELASRIADRAPVDWGRATRDASDRSGDVDRLHRVAEILAACRAIARTSAPSDPPPGDAEPARPRAEPGSEAAEPSGGGTANPMDALFTWGPFEVYERIGEGSYGEVYRALDRRLQREVALKLRPAGQPGGGSRRFLLEARRLARVRHPSVLTIHGVDEHDGRIGLWTDLLHGRTLEQRLNDPTHDDSDGDGDRADARESPSGDPELFTWAEAAHIGIELCDALQAVHEAGLVHGDVTAANVMRLEDGKILLMDFGSVVEWRGEVPEHEGTSQPARATPLTAAPELFAGNPPRPCSDVYSLGALLFRLVLRRHPVQAESWDELLQAHAESDCAPDLTDTDLPEDFARVLECALSKNPAARYATASAMGAALARAVSSGTGNLPLRLTSFVGRARELVNLEILVERDRLVTVTGAGGCGKTRLAVEAAESLRERFPDGIWFVSFAPAESARRVPGLLATALGVRETKDRSQTEAIGDRIGSDRALIVLDSCEHVTEAVARLCRELVAVCPGLHVLITSREPIGLDGERLDKLAPLAIPDPRAPDSPESLREIEAVRLFLDRAGATGARFQLTGETAPHVVEICRRLDGIPFAIELAAARVGPLSVEEIATRLGERFELLARGRSTLSHHHTLRESIDWSYERLDPEEQRLLRSASVFRSPWTLDAARDVFGDEARPGPGWHVLELASGLIDKSLVEIDVGRRSAGGTTRYRMLESVREYARDRAEEARESTSVDRRHLDHFLALVESHESKSVLDKTETLDLFESVHDDLRGAVEHARACGDIDAWCRLVASLRFFWFLRGHWTEARREYADLVDHLDRVAPGRPPLRILTAAGNLAWKRGEFAEARSHWSRGLEMATVLDDRRAVATFHDNLGILDYVENDAQAARANHEAALREQRALGYAVGEAIALNNLSAAAAECGDYDAALAACDEGAAIARRIENVHLQAAILTARGSLRLKLGQIEEARADLEESGALREPLGDRSGLATSLFNLGKAHALAGRSSCAFELVEKSLELGRELGDRSQIATSLAELGWMRLHRGELDAAGACFRESLETSRGIGFPRGSGAALLGLASLHLDRGSIAEAAEALLATLEVLSETTDPEQCVACLEQATVLAHATGQRGDGLRLLAMIDFVRRRTGLRANRLRETGQAHADALREGATGADRAACYREAERWSLDQAMDAAQRVARTAAAAKGP